MPQKTASLATWPLLLSNPLPQSWASHLVHAQVALATPTIRETQRTYQGDLHNFRHSGDYLTPARLPLPEPVSWCPSPLPGQQGPCSPDYQNEPLLWAWRIRGAPAHCQVCSLIHWSWTVTYFFLDIYSNSSHIQSICFLRTFSRGVIFILPSLGDRSQRAGPIVCPYFLNTKPFFKISQAHLHIL